MKFNGKFKTTPVYGLLPEVDIDYLVSILRDVSWQVGDKTRERMRSAIKGPCNMPPQDGRISFCDTPVFGDSYVYLWFDLAGDLFYIGKGTGNRVESLQGRSAEFKKKAASGYYKILADDMNEGYALDLEKVLLFECARQGKKLTNHAYGDALEGIQYCSSDRDGLLYYWDHLGVIARFSELTGMTVHYDARNFALRDVLDDRHIWWNMYRDVKVNDPEILAKMQKEEEQNRKRREKAREYARKRREAKATQASPCS